MLCVDRDNDLYEKGKVSGPVVGREKNLEAATALALADPEDPDSNAIFYAIKVYDDLKKEGKTVEVATCTGDKNLGYTADKVLSAQLDKIVREINPEACIMISDGGSDEELVPIIKSRLRIDSTKIVFVKQAKELEKTYFVLIEKLKDPYYAKIMLGIPALLILLFSISSYMGLGWQPVGIVVGVYLLLKLFGFEDFITSTLKDFRFSVEKTSWISYIGGFALLLVAMLIGYQSLNRADELNLGGEKLITYIISQIGFVILIAVLFVMTGKSIDAFTEKKKFMVTKYAMYMIGATLAVLVLKVGSDWVLNLYTPYVYFSDFLITLMVSIGIGYISTRIISGIRSDMLLHMKLDGREAISEHGTYLGKIVGVDAKKGELIIQTMFDKKYSLSFAVVSSIGDNVIMKTGE